MMFNWYSAPTFAVMLLFWLLGAYVLTRSPRSLVSLTAVAAQVAAAAYLLGYGMQANANSLEEWLPWNRNLLWGGMVAPSLWYWLTVLLLKDQEGADSRYLRWVGYPLGVLFALGSGVVSLGLYGDEWLYAWSAASPMPPGLLSANRYHAPAQPLLVLMIPLFMGTTVGAAVNVWRAWQRPQDDQARRRFAWLFLSALLFILGANSLTLANWLPIPWTDWGSHLILAAAMVVMAYNVAAYSLLLRNPVIWIDLLHFLTAQAIALAAYGLLFLVVVREYSFERLGLAVLTLTLVSFSHAMVASVRGLLDRLFFGQEVQRLRTDLTAAAQTAALTPDLDAVLDRAKVDISEVSAERFARLLEEALRRLNNPAALAQCELVSRIPLTLEAVRQRRDGPGLATATPLEQTQALRDTVASAIERLKPLDQDTTRGGMAALHYNILREEYLLGLPNRQIMTRHSISEATFHRYRREAIAVLAHELNRQEVLLSEPKN